MDWNGKRVLVTGAGGFIGSHLTEKLVQLGADVTAMVRYNSRSTTGHLSKLPAEIYDALTVAQGDVMDRDLIYRLIDNSGNQFVFHLAALISVPYSQHHAEEVWKNNCGGTLNVLTGAMYAGNCIKNEPRVIITSTSEVYGSAQYIPMDEKHPRVPQSAYAASKIGADALAFACHKVHGLPVTVLRPFNTFGPRQSDRAVIPSFISQALCGRIKVGNLSPTRDFTYVSDTVAGFIAAAESEAAIGREINLGTGCEISVGQLAAKLRIMIPSADFIVEEEAARVRSESSEVNRLVSNNRLAWELMRWRPEVTLDTGLKLTIEYIRQHMDEYSPGRYRM